MTCTYKQQRISLNCRIRTRKGFPVKQEHVRVSALEQWSVLSDITSLKANSQPYAAGRLEICVRLKRFVLRTSK